MVLETTWFVLWGLLWAIYFMLDGFDLGLGALMPVLAKDETERNVVRRSMGPFWDGNEVWLITAGGVTFAAFPGTYAVMFSALYSALMLILFALIVRGVCFEFRHQLDGPRWKKLWDTCLAASSFLAALLFGVAFANIFKGIPIDADGVYHGTLLTLLNVYGLLGGVFFLLMFLVHGALWQAVKTDGALERRAVSVASSLWSVLLVAAVAFLAATAFYTDLYDNYLDNPLLLAIPLLAVAGLVSVRVFLAKWNPLKAWIGSSLTIVSATLFGVIGLYPTMLPSTLDPAYSVTIGKAASSPLTLKIMLGVVLVFVPIVIAYQGWVYRLFGEKVNAELLAEEEAY